MVLCGLAPRAIATGDLDEEDVSSIGAWFFGANELAGGSLFDSVTQVRSPATGIVAVSVAIRGRNAETEDREGIIRNTGPTVDNIVGASSTTELAAYQVPTGGRLVWASSNTGSGDASAVNYRQAFESAFRWVGQ